MASTAFGASSARCQRRAISRASRQRARRVATVRVRAAFPSSSSASPWTSSPSPSLGSPSFADNVEIGDASTAAERELKFAVKPYLDANPGLVLQRVVRIAASTARVALAWVTERPDRGTVLRDAVAALGPVFVKLGQTMASREDLVGDEAAAALKGLQDRMDPFDQSRAMEILREELGLELSGDSGGNDGGDWSAAPPLVGAPGSGAPFTALSEVPVGAASLGQVYRGTLADGREVAVKVQRPDVYAQVALDMYIIRAALAWLREYWQTDTDIPAVADQVGAGLLRELDYRLEAANADAFAAKHAFLPFLRVPANVPELSGRRVMVSEWMNGRPLRDCTPTEKLSLVRMGLESSVAQLLQTGMIHADPHEGNFLLGDDGRLVMLDFGLMTEMDPGHQESMAGCVLAFIDADYDEMLEKFKGMGVLPDQPQRWVAGRWVDCSFQDFRGAFLKALFASNGSGGNEEDVHGFKPTDMTNFGDLWLKLGSLALEYAFIIPSYYVLVMRSFATFEGIAETVDGEFDIYSAAMPYAARRALAPTTASGAVALRAALVDASGALRIDRLAAAVPRRGQRDNAPSSAAAAAATAAAVATEAEDDPDMSTSTTRGNGDPSASSAGAAAGVAPGAPSSVAAAGMLTHLLLEARDGQALRRVLIEVDTLAAVTFALSPAGLRWLRTVAIEALKGWRTAAAAIVQWLGRGRGGGNGRGRGAVYSAPSGESVGAGAGLNGAPNVPRGEPRVSASSPASAYFRSAADDSAALSLRRGAWRRRRVITVLVSAHASRLWLQFGFKVGTGNPGLGFRV